MSTSTHVLTVDDLEARFGRVTYGQALRAWREGDDLSLRQMAKKIGMRPASLYDIEKGRRIPSPSRAAKIARKMGHPIATWVELALQDLLHKEKLKLRVRLEAA